MEFDSFVLALATGDLADATDERARDHADAVEFRMDLADDPLDALAAYDGDLPVVATNRPTWEGGEAGDDGRLDALRTAAEHDAVEAVDVELAAMPDGGVGVVEHAREHGAAAVVSVHDFEETPPRPELQRLAGQAGGYGDVAKLSTTADGPDDVLRLLAATRSLAADGRAVATMAMGAAGRHSRAVAPLYGSRIGYAPLRPAEATAPGQYDLATLSRLVSELGGSREE